MQFHWKQCWRLRCRKRPQRWKKAAEEPQAARLSVRAAARTVEISFFMVVISFLLRLFFRFVFVLSYVVVFPQTAQHIRTPGCLQRGLYFIGNPPFLSR